MKKFICVFLFSYTSFISFGQISNHKLWQAVKNNDIENVKQAISEGANINDKDSRNTPLFWWAILKSNLTIIKYLVSKGVNYKVQKASIACEGENCFYGNILGIAVGENKLDVVQYLVEDLKIPVNEKEWYDSKNCFCGWSPLQWSLNYGHDPITAYLLKNGANLENIDKNDPEALYKGSVKVLESFRNKKYVEYTNLEQALANPLKVYHLDLSKAGLKTFPLEILKCKNLRILDLRYNPIKKKTNYLYLRSGREMVAPPRPDTSKMMHSLPKEIGQLKKLEEFICSNNRIKTLPKEIGQLKNLKVLDCAGNRLNTLPKEIRNLKKLEELWCYRNLLNTLPPEIGHLKSLRQLTIYNNELSSLPLEIGHLKNLKVLSCYRNLLNTLPPEIGQLKKLEKLKCSENQLSILPPEIGQLHSLKQLSCGRNKLQTLPREIKNLKELKGFYCEYNPFQDIPPELFTFLKKLEYGSSERIKKIINN